MVLSGITCAPFNKTSAASQNNILIINVLYERTNHVKIISYFLHQQYIFHPLLGMVYILSLFSLITNNKKLTTRKFV